MREISRSALPVDTGHNERSQRGMEQGLTRQQIPFGLVGERRTVGFESLMALLLTLPGSCWGYLAYQASPLLYVRLAPVPVLVLLLSPALPGESLFRFAFGALWGGEYNNGAFLGRFASLSVSVVSGG